MIDVNLDSSISLLEKVARLVSAILSGLNRPKDVINTRDNVSANQASLD